METQENTVVTTEAVATSATPQEYIRKYAAKAGGRWPVWKAVNDMTDDEISEMYVASGGATVTEARMINKFYKNLVAKVTPAPAPAVEAEVVPATE